MATTDLTINQGETYRKQFIWKAGEELEPVDLTGATARMQARATVSSETVLLTLTTENGGITLGGEAGTVDLYMTDTATSAINWNIASYDLEIVMASGDVVRFLNGLITTTKEVTR